jgi:hypothetical protein
MPGDHVRVKPVVGRGLGGKQNGGHLGKSDAIGGAAGDLK